MTYDADERSSAASRPIDLYTIATATTTYRVTSHVIDVVYAGNTYTATTMSRGNQQVAQDLTGRELIVYLPITHPVVQRFAATGIPEREVQVTLVRLQERSGIAQQQWQGFAQGLSVDGHMATLRVPSLTDDAMKIRLPVVVAQRLCNHVLFDAQCNPGDGPARASFQISTTLLSQVGTTLTIASNGGKPNQWFQFGEIVHTVTGERRSVLSQVGTTLTINVPFVSPTAGDGVSVFAGCAHDVITCRDKFVNVSNFGGHPHMLTKINPFLPKGIGVIEQT